MGGLARWITIGQMTVLGVAASSHVVTDPYIATHWNACPVPCETADSSHWDYYRGLRILRSCTEPMLLNIAVNTPLRDSDMGLELYACTLSSTEGFGKSEAQVSKSPNAVQYSPKDVEMEIMWRGEQADLYSPHAEAAAQLVQAHFDHPAGQDARIAFGYSNGVVLGSYIGSMIGKDPEKGLLASFLETLRKGGLNTSGSLMQVCESNRPAAYNLGVISEASTNPEEALMTVQEALATWNGGGCVEGYGDSRKEQISVAEAALPSNRHRSHHTSHARAHAKKAFSGVHARGECETIQVHPGDDCGELAKRCGISPADFTKHNPSKTLCSSLSGGQHVCCSSGSLPDYSPKPNADGTCAAYTIQNNDDCASIAATNSITVDEIDDWNAKTWGWRGCRNLPPNGKICISPGDPPMPATMRNAVCGPQKPGTKRPKNWDDIAELNPCPLNACCNVWGQCGITPEFCRATESTTGAPGTAKNGTNGCISNCGIDIKYNTDAPTEPAVMAYYEAFNNQRPCLQLAVEAIEEVTKTGGEDGDLEIDSAWSHIHFAFANITEDFKVDMTGVEDEFEAFKRLKPPSGYEGVIKQKVLSFGGWSFSTGRDSYAIFRKGVTNAQRSRFATNVVSFAKDNDLDGLDFDWEYPSAPDIPGIPPGDPGDGERYLDFLKEVRDQLPSDKTLSVAVPSSYWYLKGFPIKEISDVVSYMVFMTYDLHGQWDWNNSHAADGCDGSACLRSHVNMTEIALAFSMITKAGVANNKIFGGVASYGRSFEMEDPSCHGPECKFTGPESGAMAGKCTRTPGYIAEAEIYQWLEDGNEDITTYYDDASAAMIAYSANGTWMSYNNKTHRSSRLVDWWYEGHFAGTALWALDLTEFVSQYPNGTRIEPTYPVNCTRSFDDLDDLASATGIEDECMNIYILQALSGNLTASLDKYQDQLDHDYDEKFGWYEDAIRESAPQSLESFVQANASSYFDCIVNEWGRNYTDRGCFSNSYSEEEVYWTPRNTTQFEADLFAASGISADWLAYGHHKDRIRSAKSGVSWTATYYGAPYLKDDFQISNPKDMIAKRLSAIADFHESLDFTAFLANESMYMGDVSDAVDGASLVVFMISSSVASMSQVAHVGEDYEDERIKTLIVLFVSAVLFIIPGLQEGAEILELVQIANMLRMVGTVGDVAMSAYDVIQAKDNAPAAVFAALLGGLGALNMVKAPESFGTAAKARRGMSAEHVETLGTEVKGGMGQVEQLVKRCF